MSLNGLFSILLVSFSILSHNNSPFLITSRIVFSLSMLSIVSTNLFRVSTGLISSFSSCDSFSMGFLMSLTGLV